MRFVSFTFHFTELFCRQEDEGMTRKALQTVAAGQQAENLLDFDDTPAEEGRASGLAATTFTSTPAAANLLAGTSANPLDDLVSIFGGSGLGNESRGGSINVNGSPFPGSVMSPVTPASTASPVPSFATGVTSPVQQKPQEDLLGLF